MTASLEAYRYGIQDGVTPAQEIVTWYYIPEDPRAKTISGLPGWVWVAANDRFYDFPIAEYYDPTSAYWDLYTLPLRAGLVLVTQAEYLAAKILWDADQVVALAAANAASLLILQTYWDDSEALMLADGLSPASIIAILGPRPT